MKKAISILLALVMLIGMFPVISAADSSDIKLVYDMVYSGATDGASIEGITYNETNNTWKFAGKHANAATITSNTKGHGTNAFLAVNQWWAITLNVPTAGAYDLSINHSVGSVSGTVGVYFSSAVSTPDAIMASGEAVNTVSFYANSGTTKGTTTPIGRVEVPTAGEYTIIFKAVANGEGGKSRQYIKEVILDCVEEYNSQPDTPQNGIKVVYNMNTDKVAGGEWVNVVDFPDTNGFWKYETAYKEFSSSAFVQENSNGFGAEAAYALNAWWAIRVYIPKSGSYSLKINHIRYSQGGTTNVYFGSASEGATAIVGKSPVGEVCFYSASQTAAADDTVGTINVDSPGEYILVFKSAKAGDGNGNGTKNRQIIKQVILDGGESIIPMTATAKNASAEVEVGATAKFEVGDVYLSNGSKYAGTFSIGDAKSDNTSVATVSADGTITGVSAGTATITAEITAGDEVLFAKMNVTVVEPSPIASAELSLSKSELKPGATASASVTAKDENGADIAENKLKVTYTTENSDIISVDSESGAIKAIKDGYATVKAAVTYNGKTVYAERSLTVLPIAPPSGVRIEYSMDVPSILNNGLMDDATFADTKNFWAYETKFGNPTLQRNTIYGAIIYPNADTWWAIRMYVPKAGSYQFKLDRGKRNAGGLAYFMFGKASEGAAAIAAKDRLALEKFYADSDVASQETDSLGVIEVDEPGEYILVIKTPSAADFKAEGMDSAKRRHFIKKIILDGGNETVEKMRFTLNAEYNEIYVGASVSTELDELYLSDGTQVSTAGATISYKSSDNNIATVDSDGNITAVSDGNATITATVTLASGEVVEALENVTVITPPDLKSVTATVENSELEEISTAQISVSGKNADGSDMILHMTSISYATDNYSVANVDSNGLITAKTPGEATITVTVRQGFVEKSATIKITVIKSRDEEDAMELSNEIAYYDFRTSAASGTAVKDLTYADTVNWLYYGYANGMKEDTSTPRTRVYGSYGIQAQPNTIGATWALKINIPKAGRYAATLTHGANVNGGIADIYILPLTDDTAEWTNDKYKVASVDFYQSATTYDISTNINDLEFKEAGEYLLVFEAVANGKGGGRQQFPKSLNLDGTGVVSYVEAFLEESEVNVCDSVRLLYRVKLSDGTWLSDADAVVFYSSDTAVATVSSKGVVTARSEGQAYITMKIKFGGKTQTYSELITVTDTTSPTKINLRAPKTVYVDGNGSFMQSVQMESGGSLKLSPESVTYTIMGGDGELSIDGEGRIRGVSAGLVEVVASTTLRGAYIESDPVFIEVLAKTDKTEPTLFTYEMRENAKENIAKYKWAKDELTLYSTKVDAYLANPDYMYNMMLAEGLPRARYCAINATDPTYSSCKYCGTDFVQEYGDEYFSVNPMSRPWKVQCLKCKRVFPSNDFGSLYELGLDEKGAYNRTKALEENGIICGRGERDENGIYVAYEQFADNPYGYGDPKGYLYNALYAELYESGLDPVSGKPITHAWGDFTIDVDGDGTPDPGYFWGVDDGYGYYTGETYGNGTAVVHPYVANYVYLGATTKAYSAVRDLMYMYMYTDDINCGRLAAIMLDRMADNLPEMSSGQWPFLVTDGGAGIGKIQGALNDCTILRIYAQACDALYPLIDDPYVIDYLSKKAEKYNLDNPKLSGSDIWENWADGILRETYRACLETKLRGGFGHKHEALATAAVVLDSMPETEEMLDWLFAPGFEDKVNLYCNGGNTNVELVGTLDRDGFANHGSPNYNSTWIDFLMYVQTALDDYGKYAKYDLFDNPKFAKMFTVFTPFTLVSKYTAQIGDSAYTGSQTFECPSIEDLVYAYKKTGNADTAKLIYLQNGMKFEGIHDDIMTKDPEAIADEIEEVIEREGPYLDSVMLTGAGFAVLRDGQYIKSAGANSTYDSQRDFWIYFGRTEGHGHMGSLNLGLEAYGYNFAPDFGYPEGANNSPKRRWMDGTLAHNTVVVNTKNQLETEYSTNPMHFDAGENVGVIDVDSSEVYAETKVYRRTLVSVKVSDEVSYGVDFFKVLGGNDQIYTFRAHSDEIFETEGLEITKQADENGNYIGTYAGEDVEYGVDPGYVETGTAKYPIGFPFLKNVRRANSVDGSFAVDFKIKDFQKVLPYNMDLHLRMTALNDFTTDEVAITSAYVPRRLQAAKYYDALEQVLIRRKGTGTLNSLFTTVYEPYRDSRYIESIEAISIEPKEGSVAATEAAQAVKVTHKDGKIDYIAYSTDAECEFSVYDEALDRTLDFKGFVGVLSYMGDELIYSYIHDGEYFGEAKNNTVRITGTVADFEKELSLSNYITVTPDSEVDTGELSDKYISVKNDGIRNGMYRIKTATELDNGDIKLDLGDVTLIRSYRDTENEHSGYIYDIAEGQSFTIGLTHEETNAPVFTPVSDMATSAGSTINVQIDAQSPIGSEIFYSANYLPRGAAFDEDSATLTWKPTSSQVGENRIEIVATDEYGRKTTLHFIINVYGSTSETNKPSGGNDHTNTGNTGNTGSSGGGSGAGGSTSTTTPTTPEISDEDGAGIRFIDLENHSWAADSINALADKGIIRGTSANTYSPANNITRADFALLLVRAFEKTSDNTENFDDVLDTDYFARELAIARNTGLVGGIGDNKFAPYDNIKRCDMILMVYRVIKDKFVGADIIRPEYPDFDSVPDYAKEAVSALIGAGLINGKNNLIAPNDNTTRAEVAVLINRLLNTYSNKVVK